MRKVKRFEIATYEAKNVDGNSKIVISRIGAYDDSGKWIKWVKLKEVLPYLSKYPVTFKQL